ncbi:MAG TPA: potassium transporter KtrA [Bacteroidales bacterium]|nr:MAG: potassium transporter KtrA [Bacteroidetes bacterium GWF2_33_38]OFY92026.1 MAG: potassium transporter KtrA [Bacteroidetes bacterium RIFOXYA2_FULL_33_7]HBF89460.1 potassium transporter KtrA [Bacteroidales bacterium]
MKKKFAVIGIGQFGKAIATTLTKHGAEVMVIDRNEEVINNIADEVALAVAIDAIDKKALLAHNITDFDAVVVAIGQDFEQRILCATLLLDLGVKRIITRSIGKNQRIILQKIGIKEILSPEDEVGYIVAEKLLNPNIISYLQLPDDYRIAEIIPPENLLNRTLIDIDLRNKYKINLITIKKQIEIKKNNSIEIEQHIIGVPSSETIIKENDCLVVFGTSHDIEKLIEINK